MWSVVGVSGCLPWRGMQVLGRMLGDAAYLFSRDHRRIAHDNVRLALGSSVKNSERKNLVRETYINLGKGLCEMAGSYRFSASKIRELVKIEGKENLDAAWE
jgi:lauroyl/myristoyl acyltransferase